MATFEQTQAHDAKPATETSKVATSPNPRARVASFDPAPSAMLPGATPARIAELAEIDGGWLSIDVLEVELGDRFGPVRRSTVARAVHRLVAAGRLEHRTREHPTHAASRLTEIRCPA